MKRQKKQTIAEHPGIAVLRGLFRSMRREDQDGYDDVKDGKFVGFIARPVGSASPDEMNALFDLAGIVPDAIEPSGSCETCVFGVPLPDGRTGTLGWSRPCCSCAAPKLTEFVPLARVRDSALKLKEDEAIFLENARDDRWWATDIVTASEEESARRQKQFKRCYRIESAMQKRALADSSVYGRRLTNKGARALLLHRSKGKKGKVA